MNTTRTGHSTLALTFPVSSYTTYGLTTLKAASLPNHIVDFVFYTEAVVQPCILCLGLIFNIINFVVLWKAHIAAMFQLCLLALTLSDIFACTFGITQLLVESVAFRGEIPFGYWHGEALASHLLYYLFLMLLCNSSLYVIIAASVRARMISQPYKLIDNTKLYHIKRILVTSFVVVLLAFLPCPIYAVWQVCYNESDDHQKCHEFFQRLPHAGAMQYYFYTLSVIFGPIMIVANVICFIVIKMALRRSTERLSQLKKDSGRQHQYHRITLMLLVILVLDALWTLPSTIQYVGLVLSPQNTVFNKQHAGYVIYDVIAEILLLFRPTYNIFVYLITNREYRTQFCQLFCCSKASSNKSVLSSIESLPSSPEHSPKRLGTPVNQNMEHVSKAQESLTLESKPNGIFHKLSPGHNEDSLLEDLNSDSIHGSQTELQGIYILDKCPSATDNSKSTNGSKL